ncbi:uncharacterized protein [Anabrus simplex]|uniref:uncharacterized protein n=1 Tax=Anabrus simplex TaxID=316456 RepID=UPI0035A389C7
MINEDELDSNIVKLYKIGSKLSRGAYGIVWKATNKETKDIVALKKIHRAFGNPVDARRTYREVMLLREFNDHPNIVKLLHIYKASNNMDFYLTFEYMEADLHLLIGHGILRENEKRFIMYQIIKAVLYIHSGNVIHRDIKPSNILIDTRFRVKIADFGLARSLKCHQECEDGCNSPPLTDYVVSRWYRAPELLLGSKRYTRGVDMWSLGCVLGEMLIEKPLFPGTSTLNQMELILATIKPPSSAEIERFFPNHEGLLLRLAKKSCPLKEMLKHAPSDGVDLVTRLLVINPCRRLICEEALYHSYVDGYEEKKPVPLLSYDVHPFVPDDIKLTVDGYRHLLYQLVEDQDMEEQRSERRKIKKVRWCSETKSQVFRHILVSSTVSEDLCAKQKYMNEDNTAHQFRQHNTYPGETWQRYFIKEEKAIHCLKKALINPESLGYISSYNPLHIADETIIQNRDSSSNNIQVAKDNAKEEYITEKNCLKNPCMDLELHIEDLGEGDSIPCHRKAKICPQNGLKVNSYESCRADTVLPQDVDSPASSQLSEDMTDDECMNAEKCSKISCTYLRDLPEEEGEEDSILCRRKHEIYPERLQKVISYESCRADTVLTKDLDTSRSSIQLSEYTMNIGLTGGASVGAGLRVTDGLRGQDSFSVELGVRVELRGGVSVGLHAENEYMNEDKCIKNSCTYSEELQEEDYLREEDSIPCHRKPEISPEGLQKVISYETCRDDTVLTEDLDSSRSSIQISEYETEDQYMNEEECIRKSCTPSEELQEEDYLGEEDSIPCYRKPKICSERLLKVVSYESYRADTYLTEELDTSCSSIQLSEYTTEDEYTNEEKCIRKSCTYAEELQDEDYLGEEDSIPCHGKPEIYPERLHKVTSYESYRADTVLTEDLDTSRSSIQLCEYTTKDEYMNEENYLKKHRMYSEELQEEDYLEEEDIPCHRKPKIYPERLLKVSSYKSCRADRALAQDIDSSGSIVRLSENTIISP